MKNTILFHSHIYIFALCLWSLGLTAQVAQPVPIGPAPQPQPAAVVATPAQPPKTTLAPIILPADPIAPIRKKPKPKPVTTGTALVPTAPVVTQTTTTSRNPFETTTARAPISAGDTAKKAALPPPVVYKGDPNNPFDLPANAVSSPSVSAGKTKTGASQYNDNIINTPRAPYVSPFKKIFNKIDNNPSHFILFTVLFCMIIFLAFVMTVYQQQVTKIWGAFSNEQALLALYREQGGRRNIHFWVIYTLFVVSGGVFGYQAARCFGAPMGGAFMGLFLCMAGVALAIVFRHALLKIIASIFPFYKEINQYAFTISIFHQAMGLVLVPFVIFIAFAPAVLQTAGLYVALAIIGLIYAYRSVRGLIIGSKYIVENRFHFFLFVCTVELAPIVIILKLANV